MSLYFVERYGSDAVHIRRGVLREDGLVSVHARFAEGELITRPLSFAGNCLVLNYATSAAGSVRVEVQDGAGQPLPGHLLADCPEIYGDELARSVTWQGRPAPTWAAGRDSPFVSGSS
jgi:hypothetical protein